ncbi:MAG: ABC transporter substrate-binding protein [Pseudomonadota bacterium]
MELQLDWVFNAQFAGVLLAKHAAMYAAKGLNVEVTPWLSGMAVTDRVAQNASVVGCAEQNLVLAAQAKGQPLVALAAMFQDSPLALMTLPDSEIASLEDLSQKPVGVHIDGAQVLDLIVDSHFEAGTGPAVTRISREDKFARLLSGEFAAVQCYGVDEPIEFAAQTGIEPTVLPLNDYGHDAYAQVIFAHRDLLRSEPEALTDLLQVVFDGWRLAAVEPKASARLLVDRFVDPDGHYHDVEGQTRSLARVLEYVEGELPLAALGRIDPERWQRTAEQFAAAGIIPSAPPLDTSLAVGFWPSAAAL